jgi:geranylgeranyl pyrophosphate synthase
VAGAILVGDLLLFKALDVMCQVEDGRLTHELVRLTGEVCNAESEQELFLRGQPPRWADCVSIARRKTGALFAFAGYAAGGRDPERSKALRSAGYLVGTAYQLADDLLDVAGDELESGKSLGTDQARAIITAASAPTPDGSDPAVYIENLCRESGEPLKPWPETLRAWGAYLDQDMRPALRKHLASLAAAHGNP